MKNQFIYEITSWLDLKQAIYNEKIKILSGAGVLNQASLTKIIFNIDGH